MNKILLTCTLLALVATVAGLDTCRAKLLLRLHNIERACIGLKRLQWDDSLAAAAQTWANHLASTGNLEHSGTPGVGENIANAITHANVVSSMFRMWSSEKSSFTNANPFPDVSIDGGPVGQYTQIIWAATDFVGCGVAKDSSSSYLVCQYQPAGNYIGQYVFLPSDVIYPPTCHPKPADTY